MSEKTPNPTTYPLPREVRAILRPAEDLTVSQWCDKHRYLSRRFTATPQLWDTSTTPYLREPLDAFTDPHVEEIGFIKCSRIGGTEWANNLIAYTGAARPMPMMYVGPEKEDVKDEFRGRVRAIFESTTSRVLKDLIPDKTGWVADAKIELTTCDLYGAWATNHGTMIRKTIGFAHFEEIDNCEAAAGRLGNTLDMLGERLTTFGYRAKLTWDGTPTLETASGWQRLQETDYRKPHVPCPHCGHYQVLSLKRIKLKKGHENERNPERISIQQLAEYECEGCKERINHKRHHKWMIDRVVWIPRQEKKPGVSELSWCKPIERLPVKKRDKKSKRIVETESLAVQPPGKKQWAPKLKGTPPLTRKRGYWINVLYSPWSSRTWSHILARFFTCGRNPEKLRVFFNSWLGEPWRDAVEKTDRDKLALKRINAHPRAHVPREAKILVAGADVQLHEIYLAIRAWGVGEKSWLVYEDTVATLDQVYEICFQTGFPVIGTDTDPLSLPLPGQPHGQLHKGNGKREMELMRCHALAIDSGFRTDEMYQFAERPGVVAVKGNQTATYRTRGSKVEYTPAGRIEPRSLILQHVNTTFFKTKLARLMNHPKGHNAEMRLHRDVTDDYLDQLTAWQYVRKLVGGKTNGRFEWVWESIAAGAPDHYGDAEVYGLALADILKVPLLREETAPVGLMGEVVKKAKKRKKAAPPPRRPDPTRVPRGFLG